MSRGFNPFVVWTQVPVASRLVEVNTKTGFSLTAGSYVVTGAVQAGTITGVSLTATATATISAITEAKTGLYHLGDSWPAGTDATTATFNSLGASKNRIVLTNTTTITATRNAPVAATDFATVTSFRVVPYV